MGKSSSRAPAAWAAPALFAFAALGGCSTAEMAGADVTVTAAAVEVPPQTPPLDAPKDDLTLGKEHFRARNYGLAELHFRRAVEQQKSNPEAWLGLAAAYDQLRRFDLADCAYKQVLKLTGSTSEFLNNRCYSYLLGVQLRGPSEHLTLTAANAPADERIQHTRKPLEQRARRRV